MWDSLLRPLLALLVRAYRRRAMLRELESLDDRMLRDIGLSRGELPAAVARSLAGATVRGDVWRIEPTPMAGNRHRSGNDNRRRERPAA